MKLFNCADTLPPRGHMAKRRSVIDAAAAVFCREGFAGANIDFIAAEAGVSRQTVYNHHGDKDKLFAAVVREITDRCNTRIFAVLDSFPDHPRDLEAELIDFATRLSQNCLCNRDGKFLFKLIQAEGQRHPELFGIWRQDGPGKIQSALASRFARLTCAGFLEVDDFDVAARQFLALINTDLHFPMMFGETLSEEQHLEAVTCAVRTFLRAYGRKARQGATAELEHQAQPAYRAPPGLKTQPGN